MSIISVKKYKCIELGDETFQILCGTKGIFKYPDVLKMNIIFEQARYHNEEDPFPMEHRVLVTKYDFSPINRKAYVGIAIRLKNKDKIYTYISNEKRIHNSDEFQEDVELAKKIISHIEKKTNQIKL